MLFIRNKRVMYESIQEDSEALLTILLANQNITNTSSREFRTAIIKYYNQKYAGKNKIRLISSLIDLVKSSKLRASAISDLLEISEIINEQDLPGIASQDTNTKQGKSLKSTTKTQTSKYNSDDIDDIVDATINTETDTISIDNDLINKIKNLAPSLKVPTAKLSLLDPLKVGADVECDPANNTLSAEGKSITKHGFLYIINVLIILLRGGKICYKIKARSEDESAITELWPTSSINKADLTSLLEAIVDYDLNLINENNSSPIYNSFMSNPTSCGNIFNKITGINYNKICKSSQIKGDLNATVADKVLGPQKLNLLKPGGYTLSELREAVITSINEKTGENSAQLINPELAKSLITMVNEVVDITKESNISIEDLLFEKSISHKKITYTYKVATDAISKDAVKKALNRIMNDFGEVLGPLFLLKYLNGSETRVFFGSDYSEAMKDYIIERDGLVIGVSAKSIKGGNAPDIKPALTILSKFITSGAPINSIVSWQKSTVTFDQLLEKHYVDNAQKIADAKGFFTMLVNAAVKGASNKSTLTQQQLLTLVDYMCGQEDCVVDLCTKMGISSLLTLVQDGFDVCDKFFNNDYDYVKNIFDKIADATGAGDRKGFPSKTEFDKLSSKSKLGYFISPLIHYAIDKANKMFGLGKKNSNQVDIISAVIRLAFNYKQIYLGVDCDDNSFTITLKFNQMDVGDWKFATKAMMTDPWKQGILITMV